MKKTLGILTVLLCATPMIYAQAEGIATHQSSDVVMALNGAAAKGKVIDSGSCGKNVNYELYDDYNLRIFGKGAMYNYKYDFDNMNVTTAPWGTKIKSVVIEDGVTRIGSHAFLGCSLTDVSIPNSVVSIGSGAFRACDALKKVKIPNSVTSIGTLAFTDCTSLVEVNIPDGIVTIENSVFSGCSSLAHIDIPNSVTSIEYDAFNGCTSLTEVIIPDAVTSIGVWAFCNCDKLKYVKIGKGVTVIDLGIFFSSDGNRKIDVEITAETPVKLLDYKVYYNTVMNNAFGYPPENITFHVPEAILGDYRKSEEWSYYKGRFSGYSSTGISSVGNVQSAMKADAVYDLQGRRVTEMLPNRIYIVNGKKVMNK